MTLLLDMLFREHGQLYFASPDNPALWYVVPEAPLPAPDSGAGPALQQLSGQTRLVLAAHWPAPGEAELAALAAIIRTRHGVAEARVQAAPPAMLQVDAMTLDIRDEGGQARQIASSPTAGSVPYNAVFSLLLDAPDAARARAALELGSPDLLCLSVRYALRLPMGVRVHIGGQLPAPAESVLERLASSANGAEDDLDTAAGAAIQAALTQGALRQDVRSALPPEHAAVRDTCQQALEQARTLVAFDLAAQLATWRARRDGAKPATSGGWISKTFGARRPPPPAPFAAQPLTLDTSANRSDLTRIPVQQTDAGQSWLSATTDLGAWAARRRATL